MELMQIREPDAGIGKRRDFLSFLQPFKSLSLLLIDLKLGSTKGLMAGGEEMAAAAAKSGHRGGGQAWFCTTGLPSDVDIEVGDMTFHLHKFPLMSKSKKIHRLLTEEREEEDEPRRVLLPDFPGGPEAFESAAKFCYGAKLDLTAWNAALIRCAAEYLEMKTTEEDDELAGENLAAMAERFLSQSVLRSLSDSVKALKSCESLSPMADVLGIPQRCIDSIASLVCSSSAAVLWNGIDTGVRRKDELLRPSSPESCWFEELTMLSLPTYKRVIAAIRSQNPRPEAIEGSLISYARCSIPGLSRRRRIPAPAVSDGEQRELLETVIVNLPDHQKHSSSSSSSLMTPRFLFGLLRTANILQASGDSTAALEKKIAGMLERAELDDLLVPNYSYLADTLYDVECIQRIFGYYMEEARPAGDSDGAGELLAVGRLLDGYLAEIASDSNLNVDKFCDIAAAMPPEARVYDDGLYRAADIYLKAHQEMGEEEKERVCSVMDCEKLTLEACTHAAQNERLPLRSMVQVLFFEQLQLRREVAGTIAGGEGEGGTWRTAARENQVMKLDMDGMKGRVNELEQECTRMKRALERMGKKGTAVAGGGAPARSRGLGTLSRRIGCRFATPVCDSRGRSVVETKRA